MKTLKEVKQAYKKKKAEEEYKKAVLHKQAGKVQNMQKEVNYGRDSC